ncbi:MAG: hypothetical protein Q4G71_13760 [Pseudomonadota bacterium]|nr:hypothetical protein [Pseudomonadota bacterium]
MNPPPPTADGALPPDARALCAATAAWLHAARPLSVWSLVLSALALAAWLLAGWGQGGAVWWASAALLAGLAERYLALRLALDARLFDALAHGHMHSLPALDTALHALGLRQADAGTARPLAARVAGARRLSRLHLAVVLLQTVLMGIAGLQ